jgi:hypothetical protein
MPEPEATAEQRADRDIQNRQAVEQNQAAAWVADTKNYTGDATLMVLEGYRLFPYRETY